MDQVVLIDVFGTYLFGLKYVAIVVAILLLVSGVDDLFIDVLYWGRRMWRAVTIYKQHDRAGYETLQRADEKPLALMVPAWQEKGVIGPMAELAASSIDYENYHIFVGTYPNDPDTQREVDAVCARFPNVHKVVCARPGPTSKADCLNNILDAIFQFERQANLSFEGFVLHDAEDVISDQELRLFNHLVDRKDLIQVPVYPFERDWYHFTSMHYMDEFAELHGKDLLVREALAGQVPSAGVGTCFSRRAVLALLADGDGIAFDIQSLTEDYDIGFRLKEKGMEEIFVRFPIIRDVGHGTRAHAWGSSASQSSVICVREYFPDTLSAAVRQKSRWIIGIVYQGYKRHRWTGNPMVNYFLWRDRKGAVNNFVTFIAMLIFLQLVVLWLVQYAWSDAPRFLSIFADDALVRGLLAANLVLMLNRIGQRVFFVSSYYGVFQGFSSLLRLFWANLINFLANCRAIRQVVVEGDPRRVAWDKTTHDFPTIGERMQSRRPLGWILVDQQALSEAELQIALANRSPGLRIGSSLVHQGVITVAQLAKAMATQSEVESESIEPYRPGPELLATIPVDLGLRYNVLPIREQGRTLVVASESTIDPVSLAALSRRLKRPVRYVIAHKGQIIVNIRKHWTPSTTDPEGELESAVTSGVISLAASRDVWADYVSRQIGLGEVLMSLGLVEATAFRALMLRHGHERQLGRYLVEAGVITSDVLERSLSLQSALQPTMTEALANWTGRQSIETLPLVPA